MQATAIRFIGLMPIAVGNHIFIHMPKTGGTTVANYLRGFHSGRDKWPLLHGHAPAASIPAHHRKGCKLFGTIRDPWSWYASWWMHAMSAHDYRGALQQYGKGSCEFPSVLRGLLNSSEPLVPANAGVIWVTRSPEEDRLKFAGSSEGLYSWAFRTIYGNDVCEFARLSHLREDLERILQAGIHPHDLPPVNTHQQRKSTPPEWTDEMIDMVWQADAAVIQKFGFDPP